MRKTTLVFALLIANAPAYAQTTSGASSSVNISNPASTDSKARVITAPPIGAPGLAAAGIETCLGSATGGLSVMGGGFTFGRTFPDEGCNIRLAARQLYAFGFQKAAMALMCQDLRVAEAMAAAGQPCPTIVADSAPAATPAPAPRRRRTSENEQKSDDEIVTGSIDQAQISAPAASPPKVISVWRNPDVIARKYRKIVPWKNPDLVGRPVVVAAAADNAASTEESWFARMNVAY